MKVRLLHLVIAIGISTVVAGVGGVFATHWVIEDEIQDLLTDDLEAQSQLLAGVLATREQPVSPEALQRLIRPIFEWDQEETLWVNVYDPETGSQVSNLEHTLPAPNPGPQPLHLELQGFQWIGYQDSEPGGPVVQLLHRQDRYEEVREEVLEGVVAPAAAVTALNLLLLVGMTYLFLRPMSQLARDIERRAADSLAPVSVETAAHEVGVLRDALNDLIMDVDRVLTREREFASDVAHELRTPLTTLKLELSSDSPDRTSLKSEVDRLVTLVNQLLILARLQRTQWRDSFEPVSLDSLYAAQLRELQGGLEEAGLQLRADLHPATVAGDRTLLEALMRNLISNTVRHCPVGTRVEVRLMTDDLHVVLSAADTGPGLDQHHREQLNAGSTRMDRRSPNLGLGLAICQKIAEVHDAALSFNQRPDGGPGLEVRIVFPRLR